MPANETIANGSGRFAARAIVRLGSFIVAGIAIYLVVQAVGSLWGKFRKPDLIADKLFISIFSLALISICTFVVFVAYRAWFFRDLTAIRWFCAIISCTVCFYASISLQTQTVEAAHPGSDAWGQLFFLVGAILSVQCYRLAVGWLQPRLGMSDERTLAQRLNSAQRVFQIIGFLIWGSGIQILDSTLPRNAKLAIGGLRGQDWSDMIKILGPLLIAILYYKIAMRMTSRRLQASMQSKG